MALPAIAAAAESPLRVADENSRHASLTLAFAQPGDTLLYLLLPLHHDTFGVTLAEAGLLLAANRLVRIAGYGWVARFYAERGPRAACLLAAAALVAFAFAVKLPREGEGRPERLGSPRFRMPSRLDTWSFIQGITLDGLFVIGMSVLAAGALPSYAVLAAGAALALRYIA